MFGAALGIASMAGCGDPMVDDQFAGKPILTIEGRIKSWDELGVDNPIKQPLRASLFWSRNGKFKLSGIEKGHMVADHSVIVEERLPLTFRVHIFKPPSQKLLVDGKYALGMILLYEDVVGEHRYIPGKTPIRGGAPINAILYAPKRIEASDSPIRFGIEAGMSEIRLPVNCETNDVVQKGKDTTFCERPLIGKACKQNNECGPEGTCLRKIWGYQFPQGYCAIQEKAASCIPNNTIRIGLNLTESKVKHYFMAACDSDNVCRTDEGYRCDPFARICLLPEPVLLEVASDFKPSELCAPKVEDDTGQTFPDLESTDSEELDGTHATVNHRTSGGSTHE